MEEDQELIEGHKSGYVAVVGRPNVGKSTLINAFMDQKVAIVTPKPQTTRIRQLAIITEPAYQIVFMDTPGMMKPRHKLDEFMMDSALSSLADAEAILWLVDVSTMPGAGDRAIAETLSQLETAVPILIAMNKSDLLTPDQVLPHSEAYRALLPTSLWLLFSAIKGSGRDELLAMIVAALPEGPRYYPADQITDLYVRDIAAELIREQILLQLRDEIPYGTAVKVEEYKERENGVLYVGATIFIERSSHKQIIIGKRGAQLRKIGALARKEIEGMAGQKVYLDLWIKVAPKWRHDALAVRRMGYKSDE